VRKFRDSYNFPCQFFLQICPNYFLFPFPKKWFQPSVKFKGHKIVNYYLIMPLMSSLVLSMSGLFVSWAVLSTKYRVRVYKKCLKIYLKNSSEKISNLLKLFKIFQKFRKFENFSKNSKFSWLFDQFLNVWKLFKFLKIFEKFRTFENCKKLKIFLTFWPVFKFLKIIQIFEDFPKVSKIWKRLKMENFSKNNFFKIQLF